MVEFRNTPPGGIEENQGKDSSSFSLDYVLEQAFENIKNNPKSQLQIAQALNENYDVPLEALAVAFPDLAETAQNAAGKEEVSAGEERNQRRVEQVEEQPENEGRTPPKIVKEKPTPDELLEFVDEIIGLTSEDYTLAELKEFGKENPGIIQTAIDLKF